MTDPSPKVYRRRRPAGVFLRAAAIVLAVLVLLAVLFFFGLRKYIAYSETGRLYLDIPWLAGYMDGKPEDDPLSSELTLTGGSSRSDFPSAEAGGQNVGSIDEPGDGSIPEADGSDAPQAPSGPAEETPAG